MRRIRQSPTTSGSPIQIASAVKRCAHCVALRGLSVNGANERATSSQTVAPDSEPAPAPLDTTSKIEPARPEEAVFAPVLVEAETPESADEPAAADDESPININRAGHLPSLDAIETVLETPETPPSMIGSYSSAGANYKIFADGSIEAETSEGTFKFASMSDFKRHLVDAKARTTPEVE